MENAYFETSEKNGEYSAGLKIHGEEEFVRTEKFTFDGVSEKI